jgi:hypothetical protein
MILWWALAVAFMALVSAPVLVPTKRHVNWGPVTFTPAGGTLSTLSGVQDVRIQTQGNLIKHSGDGDRFPTVVTNDYNDPMITVDYRDLTHLHGLTPGQRGVLVCTHRDPTNGVAAGGGAYAATLSPAVVQDTPSGGRHRDWGQGQAIFSCESTDGVTNPLSFSAL